MLKFNPAKSKFFQTVIGVTVWFLYLYVVGIELNQQFIVNIYKCAIMPMKKGLKDILIP